jgi:hypothetical protein
MVDPARLYSPVVAKMKDGRAFLVWATTDNKATVSLEFESVPEFEEWLARAVLEAGPAAIHQKLGEITRG